MAKSNRKKAELPADEVAAAKALEKFNKDHEGKTLSDTQKEKKKELQSVLGALRFVRIFNKRFPRTLAAIKGIGALGAKQYVRTEAQVKAIHASLDKAVTEVKNALAGTKATSEALVLSVEEPKDEKK